MIVDGWMLWRGEAVPTHPGEGAEVPSDPWSGQPRDPAWVRGSWQIRDGRIHRLDGRDRTAAADLGGWSVPGLVDVHCHIGIGAGGPVGRPAQEAQALADRDAGTLLVRDCGVPVDDSWVQHRADLPRLVRSGRHVARPRRYLRDLAVELEDPAMLPGEVVRQSRAGDGWVKVVADWIDRSAGAESDLDPLWPREVLRDAVAAAHDLGARVTVHCFSHAAVDDLLEAGVDGIEHGTGMDDDQMAEAAARGIAVTPTLMQADLFGVFADQAGARYPRYGATMRAMHEARRDHAERLFASGVPILPGTDAGGYQQHGSLPRELAHWVDLGVDPARVVDLATWRARDFLGAPSLSEGAPADLVVYPRDPRKDPSVLSRPTAVVLRGAVVARGDGRR